MFICIIIKLTINLICDITILTSVWIAFQVRLNHLAVYKTEKCLKFIQRNIISSKIGFDRFFNKNSFPYLYKSTLLCTLNTLNTT